MIMKRFICDVVLRLQFRDIFVTTFADFHEMKPISNRILTRFYF